MLQCWQPSGKGAFSHWGRSGSGTSQLEKRRGREMAGLPRVGETPLGIKFFKALCFCKYLPPLFLSGGKYKVWCLLQSLPIIPKPPREQGASRRNMLWGENKCKSFVKISIIASRGQGNWTNNIEFQKNFFHNKSMYRFCRAVGCKFDMAKMYIQGAS